jgi:hypothetical protein
MQKQTMRAPGNSGGALVNLNDRHDPRDPDRGPTANPTDPDRPVANPSDDQK